MGRSYLFPGQDTEHLSPYQRQLEALYDQVDRPGNRLTPAAFFKSSQYYDFVNQQYGEIPVPPGVQVISKSPTEVRYKDAEGYEHVLTRNVSGGQEGGQVTDQTTRPPILPNQQQNELIRGLGGGQGELGRQQLANALALARGEKVAALDPGIQQYLDQIQQLSQRLQGPTQLLDLDPATKAAFAAQSTAEQGKLRQQFTQDQATQLANLFGNRVNQSSIATNALGQLLQQQGLVSQQQQADAAMRELQARVALTDEERQRLNSALAGLGQAAGTKLQGFATTQGVSQAQTDAFNKLLAELTGQQTGRDIASAGLGLDYKKLEEAIRQANQNYTLGRIGAQTQQEQLDRQGGWLNNFLKISQIIGNLTGAASGGIGALSALRGNPGRATGGYTSTNTTGG